MSTVPTDPGARSLKRAQVRIVTDFFMTCILVSGGSSGIEDMVSSSGPVPYYVFRAMYGGPGNPSREAGNEALTLAVAEALEDAA